MVCQVLRFLASRSGSGRRTISAARTNVVRLIRRTRAPFRTLPVYIQFSL